MSSRTLVAISVTNPNGTVSSFVEIYGETAKEIIAKRGEMLQFAPELQADKEVVLAAVSQDGTALKYANPTLQADKEVVLAAVRNNADAYFNASDDIKYNSEVTDALVLTLFLNNDLFWDKNEIVLTAAMQYSITLVHSFLDLREDIEAVKIKNIYFLFCQYKKY